MHGTEETDARLVVWTDRSQIVASPFGRLSTVDGDDETGNRSVGFSTPAKVVRRLEEP